MATTDAITNQTLPGPVLEWTNSQMDLYRPVIVVPNSGYYYPGVSDNQSLMNALYKHRSEAYSVAAFVAEAESVPSDYTADARIVRYFGSGDIDKKLTPWGLLHHNCSCVEGHLNQVREFLSEFASWTDNHSHEIKDFEKVFTMREMADDLAAIDLSPLVRTLEGLMDAVKEARREAEDLGAPVVDDLDGAERYIESAVRQIEQ